MNQISDLKQWLDSQKVKLDQALSPHHSEESDFFNLPSAVDRPFVPSPKFKPDQYLWFEDGKNDHPEMNIVAGQLSDYEKAKALWYKNAWESVQPVNTEADNSNTFKKASEPNWEYAYDGANSWAWWDQSNAKTSALVSVDWDDDDEAIPSLVEIPFEILQTELDGGGQVADWLSDNYGWMVNGWSFVDHPDDIGEDQSPLWHEG